MKRMILLAIAAICVLQGEALAQNRRPFAVVGGFSYLRSQRESLPSDSYFPDHRLGTIQRGWSGSFSWRAFRYLDIVGEASGHYGGRSKSTRDTPVTERPQGGNLFFTLDVAERTHLFLGGPRVVIERGRFRPYAHLLAGAAHRKLSRLFLPDADLPGCSGIECDIGIDGNNSERSTGSLAWAAGGGLDFRVSDRIDLRLVQADYVRTSFDEGHQADLRLGVGVVFRF